MTRSPARIVDVGRNAAHLDDDDDDHHLRLTSYHAAGKERVIAYLCFLILGVSGC